MVISYEWTWLNKSEQYLQYVTESAWNLEYTNESKWYCDMYIFKIWWEMTENDQEMTDNELEIIVHDW